MTETKEKKNLECKEKMTLPSEEGSWTQRNG
jgi:hypothetical protein